MSGHRLQRAKPFPLTRLSRAMAGQTAVMIWERLLPALTPFLLVLGGLVVAHQWRVWAHVPLEVQPWVILVLILLAAIIGLFRLKDFKAPTFTEIVTRLAHDNGLKTDYIIGLRHKDIQPKLKLSRPKAGVAEGDPFALRFVLLLVFGFGLFLQGGIGFGGFDFTTLINLWPQ